MGRLNFDDFDLNADVLVEIRPGLETPGLREFLVRRRGFLANR